jgi:type III pantothenate kinase
MISVDSGNTSIKVLIFNEAGEVQSHYVWAHSERIQCVDWLRNQSKPIYICDSSGLQWELGRQIKHDAPWSFEIDYEESVGVDRLAAMEGLMSRFGTLPLLMVSLGTCLTYNYLSADGRFQGGGIAPGWGSRLRAMHEFTGSLPNIEPKVEVGSEPRTNSTHQSMLRGAAQGFVDEINAEIGRFQKINPNITVVVGGGDGPTFVNHLKKGIFADENWVARGLWALANK